MSRLQHVIEANAECEHCVDVSRRARAEGARDFDCRARFAALRESNGEDSGFIRDGLPSGSFGSIERSASRALSSLLPKVSVADANSRDALNERQRELVSDELVMG